ncbi:MAG: twin-arginine translocase subunit TatC [Elusimicrobia bacterium]|nr:twin-arginine translocase subunit TatC [Elusimicrobiota bacterium]
MVEDTPKTLIEHLDELRWRLILALIGVGVGMLLMLAWVNRIIAWMARPVGRLIFVTPTEAVLVKLKIAALSGFLLTLPWVLYQIWQFVAIGLTQEERRHARWVLPSAYGLFLGGSAFGWFVVVPMAVQFLVGTGTSHLRPLWTIDAYLDFSLFLTLGLGLFFELPLVLLFLAKLGIVSAGALSQRRRLVYVIIFIVAAAATPGPDVISQCLVAFPTLLLYELSIWLVRLFGGRQRA